MDTHTRVYDLLNGHVVQIVFPSEVLVVDYLYILSYFSKTICRRVKNNIDNAFKFVLILFIPLLKRYALYLIQLRLNPAVIISLVYL